MENVPRITTYAAKSADDNNTGHAASATANCVTDNNPMTFEKMRKNPCKTGNCAVDNNACAVPLCGEMCGG